MVRRPRPAHRKTQLTVPSHESVPRSRAQVSKQARPKAIDFLSESERAEPIRSAVATRPQGTRDDESDDDDTDGDSHGDEEDVDAPRIAQWIDDEEFAWQERLPDDASASLDSDVDDGDHNESRAEPFRKLRSLQDDLSTLPLGTLRNAQRSLAQAHALEDTESDSDKGSESDFSASGDGDSLSHPAKGKDNEKTFQSSKPKSGLVKRTNKHAPMEITSKRPVSRRRVVIDDRLPKSRDPRFMHAAGRFDPSKFKQQYDFLPDLRKDELSTLREHMKRARKLLANSPWHLRAEREEEVKRLEHAMKRAESTVNLDNRERTELEALHSAKQSESEKRKQGKAEWWMKRSEKRQLLEKARLDAIASASGRQGVKKAIEKRQKKASQKEKKMRPFPQRKGVEGPDGKKRRPAGPIESERGKRRRVV